MFDRLYVAPQNYPTYVDRHVDIHEHRAPTDASVSLLRELESAALKKTEEAIVVSNNKFECVIHKLRSFQDDRVIMKAIFMMNGHRMTVDYSEHSTATRESLMRGVRDAIAQAVANSCLDAIARAA